MSAEKTKKKLNSSFQIHIDEEMEDSDENKPVPYSDISDSSDHVTHSPPRESKASGANSKTADKKGPKSKLIIENDSPEIYLPRKDNVRQKVAILQLPKISNQTIVKPVEKYNPPPKLIMNAPLSKRYTSPNNLNWGGISNNNDVDNNNNNNNKSQNTPLFLSKSKESTIRMKLPKVTTNQPIMKLNPNKKASKSSSSEDFDNIFGKLKVPSIIPDRKEANDQLIVINDTPPKKKTNTTTNNNNNNRILDDIITESKPKSPIFSIQEDDDTSEMSFVFDEPARSDNKYKRNNNSNNNNKIKFLSLDEEADDIIQEKRTKSRCVIGSDDSDSSSNDSWETMRKTRSFKRKRRSILRDDDSEDYNNSISNSDPENDDDPYHGYLPGADASSEENNEKVNNNYSFDLEEEGWDVADKYERSSNKKYKLNNNNNNNKSLNLDYGDYLFGDEVEIAAPIKKVSIEDQFDQVFGVRNNNNNNNNNKKPTLISLITPVKKNKKTKKVASSMMVLTSSSEDEREEEKLVEEEREGRRNKVNSIRQNNEKAKRDKIVVQEREKELSKEKKNIKEPFGSMRKVITTDDDSPPPKFDFKRDSNGKRIGHVTSIIQISTKSLSSNSTSKSQVPKPRPSIIPPTEKSDYKKNKNEKVAAEERQSAMYKSRLERQEREKLSADEKLARELQNEEYNGSFNTLPHFLQPLHSHHRHRHHHHGHVHGFEPGDYFDAGDYGVPNYEDFGIIRVPRPRANSSSWAVSRDNFQSLRHVRGSTPSDLRNLQLMSRDITPDDYEMLLALDDNKNESKKPLKKKKSTLKSEKLKAVDEANPSCSICLENFEVGANVKCLKCTHVFHTECLDKWIEVSNTCPLCKVQME